jgi:hypothetical protein
MLRRLLYFPKEDKTFVLIIKYLIFLVVAKYLQKKENEKEIFQNQIKKFFNSDQYFREQSMIKMVRLLTIFNLLKNIGYEERFLLYLDEAIMRALLFDENSLPAKATPSPNAFEVRQFALVLAVDESSRGLFDNVRRAIKNREKLFGTGDAEIINIKNILAIQAFSFNNFEAVFTF